MKQKENFAPKSNTGKVTLQVQEKISCNPEIKIFIASILSTDIKPRVKLNKLNTKGFCPEKRMKMHEQAALKHLIRNCKITLIMC